MSSVDLRLQTSLELLAIELWLKLERINRWRLGDQDCKVEERELFTGHNLFQWRNYITRELTARNLMNHLTEDSPKIENPNYFKWIESETILHGWWLDLMIPSIADLLKFEPSCKLIWEAAHKRHSKKEDEYKIYELVSSPYELVSSTYGIKQDRGQ